MQEVKNDDGIDCIKLSSLEESKKYMRYTEIVESSILRWNSETLNMEEHADLKQRLWRQLITTCNSFVTKLIEKRKYTRAMGEFCCCHRN